MTKRPAGIRTGDLSLTGRMLFRLSHKSRSVVNGVRIRLSQSILSPSLTSHLLSYTLLARFGKSFFFFEIKKEKSEKLLNGKSDQETCRDSNRGPFAYRAIALPTEPQVTVRGEWSLNPNISPPIVHTPCTVWQIFFFFELKKEKSAKLPNRKSDQETCRDSNRGPFAYRANALPTEPQVTVRGEWSLNPT